MVMPNDVAVKNQYLISLRQCQAVTDITTVIITVVVTLCRSTRIESDHVTDIRQIIYKTVITSYK